MITRLLVANRGEIARRVFRTCRDLGIETVAIHSDADAGMPFVAEADVAVRLPGNTPAETYLDVALVLKAAADAGADAIHPGYGFLSENADFAEAVIAAGLTWVGPTPDSMRRMATKVEAKQLMEKAGVPVLSELDPDAITEADLPVLVKASSGGGGRGMRVVRDVGELAKTVELASNEAASAFGDPTVFCEPYVERGRHIEVQLLGDTHGHVLVVGDRDCSLQRRHQKVVEEAPAPGLTDAVRRTLHDAARTAGEAIGYVGAGTVEFLVEGERVYFLEMNTRLQVEHPVTECVTGLDLVALQVAVAEGRSLVSTRELASLAAARPANNSLVELVSTGSTGARGHAIEVRLYAEDPSRDYQPQSGLLTAFEVPGVRAEFENPAAYGVRLDSGVRAGNEIGTFYDAMIAKVIVWAATREEALRRLSGALSRARIHGLVTNRDFLVRLLRDPVVVDAAMHTTYLDTWDRSGTHAYDDDALVCAGLAAAFVDVEQRRSTAPVQRGIPAGWRNVVSQPQRTTFAVGDDELTVAWFGGREGFHADGVEVVSVSTSSIGTHGEVVLERSGVRHTFAVARAGDRFEVDSAFGHVTLVKRPRFTDPADQVATGSLLAPMPGSVVAVNAAAGDAVTAGQTILVLEAMKMQHTISAPADGVLTSLDVSVGQQVAAGEVLAVVAGEEPTEGDPA